MKKYILLLLCLIFISGCIGSRPVKIEANNGLRIDEFSADPRVAEYNDNVLFAVGVENVGGTTAKNVELTLFGLEKIWRESAAGKEAGAVSHNFNNEEFDPPVPVQNRPGDLKIFTKTVWPPVLPEGVETEFPITARVTFDYSTTGSITVPTISKSLLKIKTDKGERVEDAPRISNSFGPLSIGLSKGTVPIVVDNTKPDTTQEATFVIEFLNVGDGFPVTEVAGQTRERTLGLLQGSITVLGPGVQFHETDGCLSIAPTSPTKIDFTAANIDLLKLRSNGRLPLSCTIKIQRNAFTPTTSGIITFSISMGYKYFIEKTLNVHVIGTNLQTKRVFVTSGLFTGNLGGLEGADTKCQQAADTAKLGGTWKAWLSTSAVNAKDSMPDAVYKILDGAVVANNKADLIDGSIAVPINMDENKALIAATTPFAVWTGTNEAGTAVQSNCADWTSSGADKNGIPGYWGEKNNEWTTSLDVRCSTSAKLYCFEQ